MVMTVVVVVVVVVVVLFGDLKETVCSIFTLIKKNFVICPFFLWRWGPFSGHGLALRGFTITFILDTTLGRTPLDE
jgi:hypothetical protein